MQNYEKIQSMSLEELAEVIQCFNEFADTKIRCNRLELYALPRTCTQCKMAWLQEGDEDDDNE